MIFGLGSGSKVKSATCVGLQAGVGGCAIACDFGIELVVLSITCGACVCIYVWGLSPGCVMAMLTPNSAMIFVMVSYLWWVIGYVFCSTIVSTGSGIFSASFRVPTTMYMFDKSLFLKLGSFFGQYFTWWSRERQRPHWLGMPMNSKLYSTLPSPSNCGITTVCGNVFRSRTRRQMCSPKSLARYTSELSMETTCPICSPMIVRNLSSLSIWQRSIVCTQTE